MSEVDWATEEFELWHKRMLETIGDPGVFLVQCNEVDKGQAELLVEFFGSNSQFSIRSGRSNGNLTVSTAAKDLSGSWLTAINRLIADQPGLSLSALLSKAIESSPVSQDISVPSNVEISDDEMREDEFSDECFTTDFDVAMDLRKGRWRQHDDELREKQAKTSGLMQKEPNIYHHESAAFQVLSSELISLIQLGPAEGLDCDTINDSLYHWKVKISAFDPSSPLAPHIAELNTTFGYDYVELELEFTKEFPFYPPLLKLIRPRFNSDVVQALSCAELFKLSNWNPTRTVMEVLLELKAILSNFAEINLGSERNDTHMFPEGAQLPIEDLLIKLALATEIRPAVQFKTIEYQHVEKKPKLIGPFKAFKIHQAEEKNPWGKGVGYGTDSTESKWNPEAWLKSQQAKDEQIQSLLNGICVELVCHQNGAEIMRIVETSALLIFCHEQLLTAASFLELSRHLSVYETVVKILQIFFDGRLAPLLFVPIVEWPSESTSSDGQPRRLCDSLKKLLDGAKLFLSHCETAKVQVGQAQHEIKCDFRSGYLLYDKPCESEGDKVEKFAQDICKLAYLIDQKFPNVPVLKLSAASEAIIVESLETRYKQALQPLQFLDVKIPTNPSLPFQHHYCRHMPQAGILSSDMNRKSICKEWTALQNGLPLSLDSSVFVRIDYDQTNLMRFVITGPTETPYADGIFLFDLLFPPEYPREPPKVNLQTTGGGQFRFNPNLYADGKVCLSLLGTWGGEKSERWDSKTSSVLQVLVSIQALILVPEPYFNEPGFEDSIGTDQAKIISKTYNSKVRLNTVKYAMLEQLRRPPPCFTTVITTHFTLKKDVILERVEQWLKEEEGNECEIEFKVLVKELKKSLAELSRT